MRKNPYYFVILLIASFLISITVSSVFAQSNEIKDWNEIEKLHLSGWKQKEGNYPKWEITFQKAAAKVINYRLKYIKNKKDTRHLKVTFYIAYLKELGNLDSEARVFYKECLKHPKIDLSDSVIDGNKIAVFAKQRIEEINKRFSTGKKNKTYPRISVKGGSKGSPKKLPEQIKILSVS